MSGNYSGNLYHGLGDANKASPGVVSNRGQYRGFRSLSFHPKVGDGSDELAADLCKRGFLALLFVEVDGLSFYAEACGCNAHPLVIGSTAPFFLLGTSLACTLVPIPLYAG